jgi:hypothetical protein
LCRISVARICQLVAVLRVGEDIIDRQIDFDIRKFRLPLQDFLNGPNPAEVGERNQQRRIGSHQP